MRNSMESVDWRAFATLRCPKGLCKITSSSPPCCRHPRSASMGCVRSLEIPIQLGLSPLEETPCSRRTPRVSSPSSLPWAHASIYPAIDPEPLYATKSYGGNVVLVTGASRGVGRETALQYAHAGALVPILARSGDALEEMKNLILADVPGADVLVLTADVCDVEAVWGAVQSVTGALGSLIYSMLMRVLSPHLRQVRTSLLLLLLLRDLLVHFIKVLNSKDQNTWWNTFEVNVRRSFNFIRYIFFSSSIILTRLLFDDPLQKRNNFWRHSTRFGKDVRLYRCYLLVRCTTMLPRRK